MRGDDRLDDAGLDARGAPTPGGAANAPASRLDTAQSGTPSACASPFPVAPLMRTPVNEPGPRPTATPASSRRSTPAAASASATRGISSDAWLPGVRSSSSAHTRPSTATATEPSGPEVSSPR